jgi:type IV secretion system protein TrbL
VFDPIRKFLKGKASRLRLLPVAVVASLFIQLVWAQQGPGFNTTVPSQIMDQFRNQRIQWTTNVWVYANVLFGILAVIEFAWSAAVMLLEKSDLQSWTSALVRKLMWIGAFYALLLNGRIWIPAIIDSFTQIGQNAAGVGALSPSDVFMQGLGIAGALLDGASTSAFFTNPGTSLALAFAALLIVVSYTIIAINFIVTLVESYLVVSVGFIFLGFGGSRWTAPYTERYIGLAVSIGIKILLLYCLISAGLGLSLGWLDEAQGIATSARPAITAFDVMGGSLIFMMCCWQIPKLFAAVIGGSPALTGGDLVATAAVVGSAALAVGGNAVAGVGALANGGGAAAGTGSAASAGGAGSGTASAVASVGSVGSGSSTGGGSVPPPSGSTANGWVTRGQPDPPSNVFRATQGPPSGVVSLVVDWGRAAGRFRIRVGVVSTWLRASLGNRERRNYGIGRKQSVQHGESRKFRGSVGCHIRGKRRNCESPTASYGERTRESERNRCARPRRRSGQEFSASARIGALGCCFPRHAAKNPNRARGVTGGHHESFPQTQSKRSRSFQCG